MRRQLFTEDDLYRPGHPFRLVDVMHVTGMSRPTVLGAIDRGELNAFRMIQRAGSPWLFKREEVRRWWVWKQRKAS